MNFQRKKIATALGLIGAGGAFLFAGAPAQAQDIRVDVTGSNIKRVEGEGALPVQTLSRSDLDNAGVQNASELLDKISANGIDLLDRGEKARLNALSKKLRGQ